MRIIALLLALIATPASAAVVGADSHGFEVRHSIDVPLPPARALAAFGQIASWWSKQHTYSGDYRRLSLDLRPGGCWCERLDSGGGIEHMRVALYQPGERIVLTGALGPLLFEGVSGVMAVRAVRTKTGSQLVVNYRAAGFARANGTEMALGVNVVLGEQVERLRLYADKLAGKQ